MKNLIVTVILSLLFSNLAFSAEADHYTNRDHPLDDASVLVNAKANEMLQLGLIDLDRYQTDAGSSS